MKDTKILNPDFLEAKRGEIQSDWIKRAFYGFITNLFRQKTAFERYGLLMVVLQLVTIFCSYISYVTGHAFIETYIGAWVKDPAAVFWASVACIVLLEAVKMLAALPFFISIVRLQNVKYGAAVLLFLTFAFSMYISYEGAEDKVLSSAAPTLINTGEISTYYDSQIKAKEAEKLEYNTNPKYQTAKGVVFHTVLNNHVKPLTAEINRLTALRDSKVIAAENKNEAIEEASKTATTADAQTMAFIALGADGVKLIISLLTAWFFVAAAKDFEIINNEEEKENDKFGASAFGLLESMPPTEAAPKKEEAPTEAPTPRTMQFKIDPNPKNPENKGVFFEFSNNTKAPKHQNSRPVVVVKGLNKNNPMTRPEVTKLYNKYKSRRRAILRGSTSNGTIEKANANIFKLEEALKSFPNA